MAAVAGLVLLGIFWRPIGAAFYANWGAVRQTRTELGYYNAKGFAGLDKIRREADLSSAEQLFSRALTLDPGQVTARTRLTEIALSRGQYDQALVHIQAAWDAGHRDRVTRLLLGDALVAAGKVEQAVDVVRGLEWAERRLDGLAWDRYWLGEDYARAADAWRAVVGLNPGNERAVHAIVEAEAKTKSP
jgi:predicted Zn-dependent protease